MPSAFLNEGFWIALCAMVVWALSPLIVTTYATEPGWTVIPASAGNIDTGTPARFYSLGSALVSLASSAASIWVTIYIFTHIGLNNDYPARPTWGQVCLMVVWGIIAVQAALIVTQVEQPVGPSAAHAGVVVALAVDLPAAVVVMSLFPGAGRSI
jgi:hypothetical protein